MKISVCCPSYKRPKVLTLKYLPFVRVYVDIKEYEDYKKLNPEAEIISCPEGIQGNLCRVRNYILDEEFKNGADVVCIVDDDLQKIAYFENNSEYEIKKENFISFLEKYSVICEELGAYFWGVNVNSDKKCYREYSPFSTVAYIGGPFQCFIKNAGGLRYDENLPLKEDYDMSLQQLNKYRKVLRVNRFHYYCLQSKQAGGCATYRNLEREKEQFRLLQKKWGSKIVKEDSHSKKQNRKVFDYNPILKIPIKGI